MDDANTLECPHCHVQTESMKLYRLLDFTFVIQLFMYKLVPVIACPKCVRRKILVMTLKEIYKANLLFPLYLVYALIMFFVTFIPGHSRDVTA